jgi:hypothetical protein
VVVATNVLLACESFRCGDSFGIRWGSVIN